MNHTTLCLGCMEEKSTGSTCPRCSYQQGVAPISAHHLPPGTILENKYLLGKVLGQGGFGITYIAWDQKLDMKLALKEYFPQGMAARTPGSFEANGTAYLVMNYHEGITLQNYLVSIGCKIPVDQALSIFMPALDALKEVHAAGILHRFLTG